MPNNSVQGQTEPAAIAIDEVAILNQFFSRLATLAGIDDANQWIRSISSTTEGGGLIKHWINYLESIRCDKAARQLRMDTLGCISAPYDIAAIAGCAWSVSGADALKRFPQLREAIESRSFPEQGDDFHRGKALQILESLNTLSQIESGIVQFNESIGQRLHPFVVTYLYRRLQGLHQAQRIAGLEHMIDVYCRMYRYDPEVTLQVVESLCLPNRLWSQARLLHNTITPVSDRPISWRVRYLCADITILGNKTFGASAKSRRLLARVSSLLSEAVEMAEASSICHLLDTAEQVLALPSFLSQEQAEKWVGELRLRLDQAGLCVQSDIAARIALLNLSLATATRSFDEAVIHARTAAYANLTFWFPEPYWRVVETLAAGRRWGDAAKLLERPLLELWNSYQSLATTSIRTRLGYSTIIPRRAVVLSGWGIGDDIIRLAILDRIVGHGSDFAFVIDPRLAAMAKKARPSMCFPAVSRVVGPFAVTEDRYREDRYGVHDSIDGSRVTETIQEGIAAYGEVILSEDLICEYFRCEGELPPAVEGCVLMPSSSAIERMSAWLGPKVAECSRIGIAWRSSLRDQQRDRKFMRVTELATLLKLPNIEFVVLQHDLEADELAELWELTSGRIRVPEIDLRNDLEGVAALSRLLDLVVAPILSTRDLCAAAGAKVLSLSLGHLCAEQWRIETNGTTDRIFPMMTHLSERQWPNREAMIGRARELLIAMGDQ